MNTPAPIKYTPDSIEDFENEAFMLLTPKARTHNDESSFNETIQVLTTTVKIGDVTDTLEYPVTGRTPLELALALSVFTANMIDDLAEAAKGDGSYVNWHIEQGYGCTGQMTI